MLKTLGRYIGIIGLPGDIETISKWFTGLLTVAGITGTWAIVTQGVPWAVFITMGILCFGVVAYARLSEFAAANRMEHKLYVSNVGAAR